MAADLAENKVELTGKVSRTNRLKYTPTGTPVLEFTIAVPQALFEKGSVGYFQAQLFGRPAEESAHTMKIGKLVKVTGSLWTRTFKDRNGRQVEETKILASSVQEETK